MFKKSNKVLLVMGNAFSGRGFGVTAKGLGDRVLGKAVRLQVR
jgi:hypothetical protein